MNIPVEVARKRYKALGLIEELPGERTWLGRLHSWADFRDRGAVVWESLQEMLTIESAPMESYRAMHPALFDLLAECYGREPGAG